MVVSSSNFAFALATTSPQTPPSGVPAHTTPTDSASELADQLPLERSSLAATPHNRQRGPDAQRRAAPPQESFSCALFPTLQQIVTVMPEDDEDVVEGEGRFDSVMGGDRSPDFTAGRDAFIGRVGVGQLQWSFGFCEVPASVKELWEIDDAG